MTEEDIKSHAIASWRMMVAYENAIPDLPPSKRKAAEAKARHLFHNIFSGILRSLDSYNIKLVAYEEGAPYTANYPMESVNADDFNEQDELVVMKTLEPALIKDGKAFHFAKVSLMRKEDFNIKKEK